MPNSSDTSTAHQSFDDKPLWTSYDDRHIGFYHTACTPVAWSWRTQCGVLVRTYFWQLNQVRDATSKGGRQQSLIQCSQGMIFIATSKDKRKREGAMPKNLCKVPFSHATSKPDEGCGACVPSFWCSGWLNSLKILLCLARKANKYK